MDEPEQKFQDYLERENSLLSRLSAQIEFTRLYEELGVKGAVWADLGRLITDRAGHLLQSVYLPVLI